MHWIAVVPIAERLLIAVIVLVVIVVQILEELQVVKKMYL